MLVEMAERIAPLMPTALLEYGVHPRLLASVPTLLLCAVYAILYTTWPSDDAAYPMLFHGLWTLMAVPAAALGLLHWRHWQRRHSRPQRASNER